MFTLIFLFFTNFNSAAAIDCDQQVQFFPLPDSEGAPSYVNTSSASSPLHSLLDDTKQCDELINKQLFNKTKISSCPDDALVDIDLIPYSVFPVGKNILPYMQLNISIRGRADQIHELFFQFRCLYAPNQNDYLCHRHNIQIQKWGRMIWPCRRLEFKNGQTAQLAVFHFSYTCFQLFSHSQYAIEIYIFRKDQSICRKTLIVTVPLERQLDPRIDQFYRGNTAGSLHDDKWSPLLFADISSDNAIYIHLNPMEWIKPNRRQNINISIYSPIATTVKDDGENGTRTAQLLLSERIFAQNGNNTTLLALTKQTGRKRYQWKWANVDSGEYTLYAFLDDGRCQLVCHDADDNDCQLCPHTLLNLTLAEPKYSLQWRRTMTLMATAKYVGVVIFVILIFTSLFLLASLLYFRFWRPRVISRQRPRSLQLINQPTVLVLYTDDCQPHFDAVMALCRTLEQGANARCILDHLDFLENPALRPSIWLVEKLAECDFVLTIFSECSKRVLAGEKLIQRRHFPDHFNTAIGFITAKINEIASTEGVLLPKQRIENGTGHHHVKQQLGTTITSTTSADGGSTSRQPSTFMQQHSRLHRFIFARLSYSPPSSIPAFFTSMQFGGGGPLALPEQIGPLIARLHGIPHVNTNRCTDCSVPLGSDSRFEHQADLAPLQEAIEKFQRFTTENPNWINERFVNKLGKEEDEERISPSTIIGSDSARRKIPNSVEQAELAEQFGLLKPDEEEEDAEGENRIEGSQRGENKQPQKKVESLCASKKYQLIGRPEDYCSSDDDLA